MGKRTQREVKHTDTSSRFSTSMSTARPCLPPAIFIFQFEERRGKNIQTATHTFAMTSPKKKKRKALERDEKNRSQPSSRILALWGWRRTGIRHKQKEKVEERDGKGNRSTLFVFHYLRLRSSSRLTVSHEQRRVFSRGRRRKRTKHVQSVHRSPSSVFVVTI